MDDRRIFSEQEAADLIVSAAKLQESEGDQSRYSAGVSWTELQKMASDVGVDPEFLRRALATQGQSQPTQKSAPRQFLGMPLSEEFEKVVDAELPPDNFDVIASEFYNPGYGGSAGTYGGYGGPSIIGRMMKGQFYEGLAYGTMEVSSRHGRTRIKVNTSNAIATWAIWFPLALLGLLIAVPITAKNSPEMVPLALALWGGSVAIVWAALGMALKSSREKVLDKISRVATAVEDEAAILGENLSNTQTQPIDEEVSIRQNLLGD